MESVDLKIASAVCYVDDLNAGSLLSADSEKPKSHTVDIGSPAMSVPKDVEPIDNTAHDKSSLDKSFVNSGTSHENVAV